jgi:hypothetical protein
MSNRTVYVYRISLDVPVMTFDIPKGARFLHAAEQHRKIAMWYEIPDPDAPKVLHRYALLGTGGWIADDSVYLATTLHYDGDLVLHLYEVKA